MIFKNVFAFEILFCVKNHHLSTSETSFLGKISNFPLKRQKLIIWYFHYIRDQIFNFFNSSNTFLALVLHFPLPPQYITNTYGFHFSNRVSAESICTTSRWWTRRITRNESTSSSCCRGYTAQRRPWARQRSWYRRRTTARWAYGGTCYSPCATRIRYWRRWVGV